MKQLFNQIRNSHDLIYRIVLFTLCLAAVVWVLPKSLSFQYEFEKGKPWLHDDLIAPFDFGIQKSTAELDRDKAIVKANTKPYFNKVDSIPRVSKKSFTKTAEALNLEDALIEKGQFLLDRLYQTGIIESHESVKEKDDLYEVYLRTDLYPELIPLDSLLNLSEAKAEIDKALAGSNGKRDSLLRSALLQSIEINILYDEESSTKALKAALDEIPDTYGSVLRDEKIINRGELINDEQFLKLQSLKQAYTKRNSEYKDGWLVSAGQAVLILFSMLVLVFFIRIFRRHQSNTTNRFTFILLLFTFFIVLTAVLVSFDLISIYLIPYCIIPILLRTFFDIRLALFVHFLCMLVIGYFAPNGFEFVFLQVMAGSAALFYLSDLRRRAQILLTILVIFGVYALGYTAISIQHEGNLAEIDWSHLLYFAASSLFTLLIYPLIFVFEKLFGFLSDITLVELGDTNNKLLRELSEKAPGTFQHSIQVANLAEKAAQKTDANALLVRIGALYHDIGKMDNPEFFIENQVGQNNPHDDVTYKESASIIIKHVISGIEKARKAALPEILIDFIRTHHGTTRVEYFYRKSFAEKAENEIIKEEDYRYPGPKPYSKETAILMMADAIEASSRSLSTYTDESIDELVENIINAQIQAEQFSNAGVTFKDITVIKALFKQMLKNIYHVRVPYPKAV